MIFVYLSRKLKQTFMRRKRKQVFSPLFSCNSDKSRFGQKRHGEGDYPARLLLMFPWISTVSRLIILIIGKLHEISEDSSLVCIDHFMEEIINLQINAFAISHKLHHKQNSSTLGNVTYRRRLSDGSVTVRQINQLSTFCAALHVLVLVKVHACVVCVE